MSNTLKEVSDFLQNNDDYSIVAHPGPDGDSIGSILGLGLALKKLGKRVRMYSSDPIPKSFYFLDAVSEITLGIPSDYGDNLIVLDCSDEKRLMVQKVDYEKFSTVVNIDHHPFNTKFGALNYCDSERIATAELVYFLVSTLDIKLTKDIAEPLYLGIVTDSGWFGYDNTSPTTHEIIGALLRVGVSPARFKTELEKINLNYLKFLGYAFGKIKQFNKGKVSYLSISEKELLDHGLKDFAEADGLVDYLRNIEGTEVAILVKEEKDQYKFSMRSKDSFDVGQLCREYGGGGHKKAAGFSTTKIPDTIVKEITEKISN